MKKNSTQHLLFVIFLFSLLFGTTLNAQVGREFWFVAPEVTEDHSDDPVLFNITAFDQPAHVKIYLGPDQTNAIYDTIVPANTQIKYQGDKENLENKPVNTKNDMGVFIKSDQDISVYYEVVGAKEDPKTKEKTARNPDKFTLKGENALGTKFYVPSQKDFNNKSKTSWDDPARERIDIVATENGTEIKIVPTDDVIGHAAGETITITLNRGQTYSVWATKDGEEAARHLGGTYIESTKPIAVTISDDSILAPGKGHYDLIGDQIIPIDVIGTEYIAMNTTFGQVDDQPKKEDDGTNTIIKDVDIKSDQKVYILATEEGTTITINNNTSTQHTPNKGELVSLTIPPDQNAYHIASDKPIYVYQVTGIPNDGSPHAPQGTELGSALLPPITCTGSTSISFTRDLNERFWVQIMTKDSNKEEFKLVDKDGIEVNGYFDNNDVVKWHAVQGMETSDDPWVTAVVQMGDGEAGLSTGKPYTISNDGLFHLSILDENNSSMSFGYFSSFSSLRIKEPEALCETEGNITLETQEQMNSYKWHHAIDEFHHEVIASDVPSIEVSEPGKYWVTATSLADAGCELTDTVEILSATPVFSIEGDTVVCPGEPLTFTASPADTYDYVWPDNITGNSYTIANGLMPDEDIEITLSATYNITETDQCVKNETQSITARSVPKVDWSVAGQEICLGDTLKAVVISGEELIVEYQWSIDGNPVPNHNEPYIVPAESGADYNYSLTVITEDNCDVDKTINLTVHALPDVDIADDAACPGDDRTFTLADIPGNTYLWQDSSRVNTLSTENFLTMSTTDSIYVEVTDANGCVGRDSAFFKIHNEQVFSFGKEKVVCKDNPMRIEIDDNFTNYQWEFNGNPISPAPDPGHIYSLPNADYSNEGMYTIKAIDQVNGCDVEGFFDLDVKEMPDLQLADTLSICKSETSNLIQLGNNNPPYDYFEWVDLDDPAATVLSDTTWLTVRNAGRYQLTATQRDNGCYSIATITVNSWGNPSFDIPDSEFCPNVEINLAFDRNEHNWFSQGITAIDREPRNHHWFTRNEQGELISYHEGINLGDKEDGNPEAGIYFLRVEDEACKFIDDVKISYHELTEVELEDATICDNDTYTLEIPEALTSPDIAYFWSHEGSTNPEATDTYWEVSEDRNYSLNIEDQNGCSNTGTMTLSHRPAPKFVLGTDDDKCLGDTLMVMAEPTFTRYEWNGNTADGQTNVYTTTATGYDLDFSLQIWDENGCTATETASIDVFALPVVDLGPDRAECPGYEIQLTVPDFKEIYWTTREQNVTSVTVANGKHKVKVVDDNGCTSQDSMTFSWHRLPNIELGPDLFICPVEYPEEARIEAPEGYKSYTWHDGRMGRSITANLMDTLNAVYVTDNNDCIGWDTKVVDVLGYPGYSLGNDTTACDSDDLILNAGAERIFEYAGEQTITPFIDYRWNTGNNEQTQEITEPGDYWVEIFDGCFFLRDTIHVDYYPTPEITRLDTLYYKQVSVLADNGTQPYQFALDDEDRLQNDNTFKNINNGEHTVYVEDKNGCMAYTIFTLNSTYDIDVPNFFTPNNDGFNDTWVIDGLERLPDSEVSIFDRYGKLLRKFKASESISWDGEYQNKPVPSDDYWYVIYLKPVEKLIKGNVTVKR